MAITLRDAAAQDETFLREVYASTRANEMALVPWTNEQKAAFLNFQFDAQNSYYRAQYPAARFQVVCNDDEPIGRLYVLREDEQIRILDVTILPDYRAQGLGSTLIDELLDEAIATKKTLTVWVEADNRSQSLFRRKGFLMVHEEDFNQLLEFRSVAQDRTT
jgi:ribosomal protein S18 acetylase RimI-like enzyme